MTTPALSELPDLTDEQKNSLRGHGLLDDGVPYDPLLSNNVQRPSSCPVEGQVEAFDAGWNAHQKGLSRETVWVLANPSARDWALMAWDVRDLEAVKHGP